MRGRFDRGAPSALITGFHNATNHRNHWSRADQVLMRLYRAFGIEFGAISEYNPPYDRPGRARTPGF